MGEQRSPEDLPPPYVPPPDKIIIVRVHRSGPALHQVHLSIDAGELDWMETQAYLEFAAGACDIFGAVLDDDDEEDDENVDADADDAEE